MYGDFLVETLETDVAVVGGGLAGCMAAISAANRGVSVVILEKANTRRSGCAGSGIDHLWSYIPPVHEKMGWTLEDLVEDHAKIIAEDFLRRDLLRLIAANMYELVLKLEGFGLRFRFPDSRAPGNFRIVYQFHSVPSSFNFEGRNIKPVLTAEAQKRGVKIVNRVMALELLKEGDRVCGVVGVSTREEKVYLVKAKSVILATSGRISRLSRSFLGANFNRRLPPSGTTGDGKIMAFKAGAELINMEFFGDRHTTFLNYTMAGGAPKNTLQPCARVVRADGTVVIPRMSAYDWDRLGKLPDSPENLRSAMAERRRVESRRLAEALGGAAPLYLDCAEGTAEEVAYVRWSMSNEGKMWILNRFLEENGVDLRRDKLEFGLGDLEMSGSSAAGVWVDADCQSTVEGLLACGDEIGGVPWACGPGAIATGWRAGEVAAEQGARRRAQGRPEAAQVEEVMARLRELTGRSRGDAWIEVEYALQGIMAAAFRDRGGPVPVTSDALLAHALTRVEDLTASARMVAHSPHELMRCLEVQNLADCARLILRAALERKESRRLLRKEDWPERNDAEWFAFLGLTKGASSREVRFRKIPLAGQ
ncbi:MAG: FAD-dependent oxidoreductase [Moorellales bacterium]